MKKKEARRAEKEFSSDEFVARLIAKDPEALALVVHAYTTQLYRASLGIGFKPQMADDLTQAVWATFFDVAANFKGRSHIRTFLFSILYNKAVQGI